MRLLDSITVCHEGTERSVNLCVGDLASIPSSEAVDLLVVSAFPDDYVPTSGSLVGALDRRGVSLATLAENKAIDLREFCSCWLSGEIAKPDLHFRRILCFEPLIRGCAAEVVGDVFRSIVPFTTGTPPISRIAMPILASGDQGQDRGVMLDAMLDASVHWLKTGLPLDCVNIVVQEQRDTPSVRDTFASAKQRHSQDKETTVSRKEYDLFISYSHQDKDHVDFLVQEIKGCRPSCRLFLDRLELDIGSPWQQHILEAIDHCRKVVAVLSPHYLKSRICKEEFNIALYRHRDSEDGILLPIYLQTVELPTYMKLIHYSDVREVDKAKIQRASQEIASRL